MSSEAPSSSAAAATAPRLSRPRSRLKRIASSLSSISPLADLGYAANMVGIGWILFRCILSLADIFSDILVIANFHTQSQLYEQQSQDEKYIQYPSPKNLADTFPGIDNVVSIFYRKNIFLAALLLFLARICISVIDGYHADRTDHSSQVAAATAADVDLEQNASDMSPSNESAAEYRRWHSSSSMNALIGFFISALQIRASLELFVIIRERWNLINIASRDQKHRRELQRLDKNPQNARLPSKAYEIQRVTDSRHQRQLNLQTAEFRLSKILFFEAMLESVPQMFIQLQSVVYDVVANAYTKLESEEGGENFDPNAIRSGLTLTLASLFISVLSASVTLTSFYFDDGSLWVAAVAFVKFLSELMLRVLSWHFLFLIDVQTSMLLFGVFAALAILDAVITRTGTRHGKQCFFDFSSNNLGAAFIPGICRLVVVFDPSKSMGVRPAKLKAFALVSIRVIFWTAVRMLEALVIGQLFLGPEPDLPEKTKEQPIVTEVYSVYSNAFSRTMQANVAASVAIIIIVRILYTYYPQGLRSCWRAPAAKTIDSETELEPTIAEKGVHE